MGPVTVQIRRIGAEEGELLREVRLRSLQESPEAFGSRYEDQVTYPSEYWADTARVRSEGTGHATFVAERDGAAIGVVGGYRQNDRSDEVELVSMWVAPEARRDGVGMVLVETVVDWARVTGARQVSLWVVDGNDRAVALYERCGFELTADREAHPNDPCRDELRYLLLLS